METELKEKQWVTVRPEFDIPELLRPDGKPTRGRIERFMEDGAVEVRVPIGGADVDEHSQAVPYQPPELDPDHAS